MISIQANRVSYILQMFYSKYISMVVNSAGEDRTRSCLLVTSSAFLLTRRTLCLIYLYLNWSELVMWPWPGTRKLKKLRKPLGYLQTSLTDTTKSSNTWFKLSIWNICIKKGKYETAFAWQSLGKKKKSSYKRFFFHLALSLREAWCHAVLFGRETFLTCFL